MMPRPARSPPPASPASATTHAIFGVQSEPDLSVSGLGESSSQNITTRKRMRPDDLCHDNQIEEIKNMLTNWKTEQDIILKKLISDVAELKAQNKQIKDSNQEIEKSIFHMNKGYEEMRSKIHEYEKEQKGLKDCISGLQQKIQDIQYTSRTSSIEIRNVPMPEKESVTDLISLVTKIGNTMQLDIKSSDVRDVYRLPGKVGSIRTIVAEFTSVHMKNNLLSSNRSFNRSRKLEDKLNTETICLPGKRQPVYIAEYMPPTIRKTFYIAREFAKANKYAFCWCSNGSVFLRKDKGMKQIRVESEYCLNKLKTQQ